MFFTYVQFFFFLSTAIFFTNVLLDPTQCYLPYVTAQVYLSRSLFFIFMSTKFICILPLARYLTCHVTFFYYFIYQKYIF